MGVSASESPEPVADADGQDHHVEVTYGELYEVEAHARDVVARDDAVEAAAWAEASTGFPKGEWTRRLPNGMKIMGSPYEPKFTLKDASERTVAIVQSYDAAFEMAKPEEASL